MSGPPSQPRDTISALTGLRFIAALGVVLFHFQTYDLHAFSSAFVPLIAFGSNGVGIFFILSGYVIAFNYLDWFQDGLDRRGTFLWARVTRITPMHLIGLALMTPVTLLSFQSDPREPVSISAISWLLNLLHIQGWIPSPSFNTWNLPSWSISAEMFFYFVFPVFAFGVLRHIRTTKSVSILIGCLFLIGGVFVGVLLHALPAQHVEGIAYSPIVRVWEFFIGCVLGAYRSRTGKSIGAIRDWSLTWFRRRAGRP